jgi:hypothetical protein
MALPNFEAAYEKGHHMRLPIVRRIEAGIVLLAVIVS